MLRARAFPDADPDLPGLAAPGTVTLVILPGLPRDRPRPSANLIRRVNAYLQPRRGLGTRLRVIGPDYAARTVSATLRIRPGSDPPTVIASATQALHDWLDPLGDGGDGSGPPPLERDVLRTEVLTRLAGVAGVAEVDGLALTAGPVAPADWTPWTLTTWGPIVLTPETST